MLPLGRSKNGSRMALGPLSLLLAYWILGAGISVTAAIIKSGNLADDMARDGWTWRALAEGADYAGRGVGSGTKGLGNIADAGKAADVGKGLDAQSTLEKLRGIKSIRPNRVAPDSGVKPPLTNEPKDPIIPRPGQPQKPTTEVLPNGPLEASSTASLGGLQRLVSSAQIGVNKILIQINRFSNPMATKMNKWFSSLSVFFKRAKPQFISNMIERSQQQKEAARLATVAAAAEVAAKEAEKARFNGLVEELRTLSSGKKKPTPAEWTSLMKHRNPQNKYLPTIHETGEGV